MFGNKRLNSKIESCIKANVLSVSEIFPHRSQTIELIDLVFKYFCRLKVTKDSKIFLVFKPLNHIPPRTQKLLKSRVLFCFVYLTFISNKFSVISVNFSFVVILVVVTTLTNMFLLSDICIYGIDRCISV